MKKPSRCRISENAFHLLHKVLTHRTNQEQLQYSAKRLRTSYMEAPYRIIIIAKNVMNSVLKRVIR